MTYPHDLEKAALRGEPSYIWRDGQQRRLEMILQAAGERIHGTVLEVGCGVGQYMHHLAPIAGKVTGLDFEFERVKDTHALGLDAVNAAGESLPYPADSFDVVISNEVIEHVMDDRTAVAEMVRVLKPGGRLVLFCPNRGYPFETHGIYWKGKYQFGNKLFVNYLPKSMRDKLAPHVRVYSAKDLRKLFDRLPVHFVRSAIIFGGYDNFIARLGGVGKVIRAVLQSLEHTPLRWFGLSHFWIIEKVGE